MGFCLLRSTPVFLDLSRHEAYPRVCGDLNRIADHVKQTAKQETGQTLLPISGIRVFY